MNIERFERYLEGHRLISNRWLGENEEGLETACFVAALAPEGADRTDPAALGVPPWIGSALLWLDDTSRDQAEREERARRLVPVLRRLEDPQYGEALRRCDFECRAAALRVALEHSVTSKEVDPLLKVVDRVLELLDRASAGVEVTTEDWKGAMSEISQQWEKIVYLPTTEGALEVVYMSAYFTLVDGADSAMEAAAAITDAEGLGTPGCSAPRIADAWLGALERAVGQADSRPTLVNVEQVPRGRERRPRG